MKSTGLAPLVERADQILGVAARTVANATRITPRNFAEELDRTTRLFRSGDAGAPAFVYGPEKQVDARTLAALEEVASTCRALGAIGGLYADRAEELALEAELTGAVATPRLRELACARYAPTDRFSREADELALSWVNGEAGRATPLPSAEGAHAGERVRTDDERDARSLVSLLRAELGRRRVPVRVSIEHGLAPLAAVGNGVVHVAADRAIDERAARRTVLHEVEGHVLPQLRATRLPLRIFEAATARGSDDQEGYALLLEKRTGFLEGGRRAELGLRHIAACALHGGATVVEACRRLLDLGARVEDAVRIALRAHRGGVGGLGGLGRERVYLPALLRVEHALLARPDLERALTAGRVSAFGAPTLLPFVDGSEHERDDAPESE